MMKQFFLGLSLLAIAGLWTGCSNDEITDTSNDKQSIEFRVQGGMPTLRSTGTTPTYVDAFVVYGTDNAATANIFDGVTVAYQVGGGYDYNPKRYYTEGAATANFVAYSPATAKITTATVPVGLATASFDYTVPKPDNTGNTTQEDLLITGTGVDVPTTSPATVALAFQHALSRIFVKATNGLSETVTIKGLTLKNLNSTGTITGTPAAAWTWAWGSQASPINYSYVLAQTGVAVPTDVTAPTLVTSMEQGMMVIPQTTQAGTVLEVTYDVANLKGQKAEVDVSEIEFEMGNQYAIKIDFDATATNLIEIKFTIEVAKFADIVDIP